MINVPIGHNCHVTESLRIVGARNCSYPFDWIGRDLNNYNKYPLAVLALKNDDEIETFCSELFSENDKTFENYGINFPHDDTVDIKDKHCRRIKRLHEHLRKAEKVNIFFATRWENLDDDVLESFEAFRNINSNVHMYTINAFKSGVPEKFKDNITCFFIDYTEDKIPWYEHLQIKDWKYDHSDYRRFLIETYRNLKESGKI
jgi:hypothetical protein